MPHGGNTVTKRSFGSCYTKWGKMHFLAYGSAVLCTCKYTVHVKANEIDISDLHVVDNVIFLKLRFTTYKIQK